MRARTRSTGYPDPRERLAVTQASSLGVPPRPSVLARWPRTRRNPESSGLSSEHARGMPGERARATREVAIVSLDDCEAIATAASRLVSSPRRPRRVPIPSGERLCARCRASRLARSRDVARDARHARRPKPRIAREDTRREVRTRTMLASGNDVRRCAFRRGAPSARSSRTYARTRATDAVQVFRGSQGGTRIPRFP
jgi:hypothetical protein